MNSQQYQMMRVVQKIPVFQGFAVEDVVRLLKICQSAMFQPGEVIYTIGGRSHEMLILLKGKLSVTGEAGEVLAMLSAGTSTGEMGLFTGAPRSANISAAESSACLLIRRADLMTLFSSHPQMHLRMLQNMVNLLSDRLSRANQLNEELMAKLEQDEDLADDDEEDEDGAADEDSDDGDEDEDDDEDDDEEEDNGPRE